MANDSSFSSYLAIPFPLSVGSFVLSDALKFSSDFTRFDCLVVGELCSDASTPFRLLLLLGVFGDGEGKLTMALAALLRVLRADMASCASIPSSKHEKEKRVWS